jgi:hypothetical protein
MKNSPTDQKLKKAIEAANNSFWAEIVKHYPEIKTGDFSPEATVRWDQACEKAVTTWINSNRPSDPNVIIDGNAYKMDTDGKTLLGAAVLTDGSVDNSWYEVSEFDEKTNKAISLLQEITKN